MPENIKCLQISDIHLNGKVIEKVQASNEMKRIQTCNLRKFFLRKRLAVTNNAKLLQSFKMNNATFKMNNATWYVRRCNITCPVQTRAGLNFVNSES